MTWLFPILHLRVGPKIAVATSGAYIHVLDVETGNPVHPPPAEPHHSGPIRHIAVDEAFQHLITVGEDKKVKVWKLSEMVLLSTREIPKKATNLLLTRDGQTIVVGDKFGDVFSYPFNPPAEKPAPAKILEPGKLKRDGVASHENDEGTLVLGHASSITSLTLSHDEKYLVTSDRDEHVRVSWYPEGWNIERFCLGHTKFVSGVCFSASNHSDLISGGGDASLYIWDWLSGTLKGTVPILDIVRPHMQVKGGRSRWKALTRAASRFNTKRARKQKAQRAAASQSEEAAPSTPIEQILPPAEETLAVTNIKSYRMHDGTDIVVFTALGARGLYYMVDSSLGETTVIHSVDLGDPVMEFTLIPGGTGLLASVDTSWKISSLATASPPSDDDGNSNKKRVTYLQWANGQFAAKESSDTSPLLIGLNSIATFAAPDEITKLDLYNDLVALPKNTDEWDGDEESDDGGDEGGPAPSDDPEEVKRRGGRTGEKVLARQKLKETLSKEAGTLVKEGEDRRAQKKPKLDSSKVDS